MDKVSDIDDAAVPKVVSRMLRNWQQSADAEKDNRKRGLNALKFRRGGEDQWDSGVYDMFGGLNKPRDSFNQVPQFIHQITNDMRMNMPQIRFTASDDGDDKVAELLEDVVREIQNTSDAEVAYDTATDSQVTNGWGYFRLITKYADKKSKHKDITIRWVPNPFKIYDDPNASMQDFSDRKFLVEVEDIELNDFNDQYKSKKGDVKYDTDKLESIGDAAPEWATNNMVRIAEYWEVKNDTKTIYFDEKGNVTETKTDDSREIDDPKVKWYKCTGCEVLEEADWDGIYIPYVRVSGETLYIDGKVYYLGLVDAMIPVQKQFNYFMNNASYKTTLPPLAPFILDPEQIEGYEKFWQNMNTDPTPYLPARLFKESKQYPYPSRSNNSVDLNSDLTMIQQAQQNFYNVTGIYPASLGQESNEKSGRAIMARQKEGDVSTFHFQDNFARAQRCGGRMLEDLIKKTYDGSRTITAMKEDKTKYKVKINQDHEDETGSKVHYDFTKGNYSVNVTTGPSYNTKKMEAADQASQLIQSFPQIMQTPAGPELIRSMDLVQADMIADGLEKALPPQFQTPPELKDMPPKVASALQQSQVQLQQLQQQLQEAQQIIQQGAQEMQGLQSELKNKQADAQMKMADSQTKMQDAQRKHEYDMASLSIQNKKIDQDAVFRQAEIALKDKALEIELISLGVQHDQSQSQMDNAAIDRAVDQSHDLRMKMMDQDHAHELAITNAALNPVDMNANLDNTDENSGSQGSDIE